MNIKKKYLSSLVVFCIISLQILPAQNFGLQVKNNKITYTNDSKGNRILDFSYCGYKSSEQDIPNVNNQIFVPKQEGDASEIIQRAISYVSGLKPDAKRVSRSGFIR